jgi:3D (Asp-Asp-Asp) domain-containing protein
MFSTCAGVLLSLALTAHPTHRPARHHAPRPMRAIATAYCTTGTTDGGTRTRRGIVAADPRVLPIGSVIRIAGLGARPQTFVVADTGAAVKGRRVDIFLPSCRAAKRFGRRHVLVSRITSPTRAE